MSIEWIKIEDGLPEHGVDVLVYYSDGSIVQAFMRKSTNSWHAGLQVMDAMCSTENTDHELVCPEYITHYMYLPNPPAK